MTLAPALAIVVNFGRIAILAALNSSALSYGPRLFTFLRLMGALSVGLCALGRRC